MMMMMMTRSLSLIMIIMLCVGTTYAHVNVQCDGTVNNQQSDPLVISGAADGTVTFSVGGRDVGGYDNNVECWMKLESPDIASTESMSVVFTFFHTEENHDTVTLYDGTTMQQIGSALSGDLLAPLVRKQSGTGSSSLLIRFKSDNAHSDAETEQMGFEATFIRGEQCFNDCSGRGTCSDGVCGQCGNAFLGDDCSVEAVELTATNPTSQIRDLPPGSYKYFFYAPTSNAGFLVDLVDEGHSSSDAYLLGGVNRAPRLGYSSWDFAAWLDWYYDRTDVHYVRGRYIRSGTVLYFGVANVKSRATENVDATITLRTASYGQFPCLLDCSGHGTCSGSSGQCTCADGWEGTGWSSPTSCRFEIEDAVMDTTVQKTGLRIGDWNYFSFSVDAEQANDRTLQVDLSTDSFYSHLILLVRKGSVPRLRQGLIPSFDAFDADYGDSDGFALAGGAAQSIMIDMAHLSEGEYYVGVYNIWGYTGFDEVSHDEADYSLYVNLFAAGLPCPRHDGHFCNANAAGASNRCDFNTGICECDRSYFGEDCSVYARPFDLTAGSTGLVGSFTDRSLEVGSTDFFSVAVNATDVLDGYNLVIDVHKRVAGENSNPIVLARLGDVPFSADASQFDEHDFLSNYRHDDDHQIVLDREELARQGGIYVISVFNADSIDAPTTGATLHYDITATMSRTVACPTGRNGAECSGHGTCDENLGRCNCDSGFTLDDCSAFGIDRVPIDLGTGIGSIVVDDANTNLAPDGWHFFSFEVGCWKQGVSVKLEVDAATSGSSLPLLFVRREELPLMFAHMTDYYDFYSGPQIYSLTQKLLVQHCGSSCITQPSSNFGTVYSTEGFTNQANGEYGVHPGIYFVGVYNDVESTASINKFTLTVQWRDASGPTSCAEAQCFAGFLGDMCQVTCPGMNPVAGYTNAPMRSEGACSEFGTCALDPSDNSAAVCACDDAHFGDACDIACPFVITNADGTSDPCSGRGTCSYDASGEGSTSCACRAGFGGDGCEIGCPNQCSAHGQCDVHTIASGDSIERCVCDSGYGGDDCSAECPGLCSSRGVCQSDGSCACDVGYVGDACAYTCPGLVHESGAISASCSGNGTCAYDVGAEAATCRCFAGSQGEACSEFAPISAASSTDAAVSKGAIAGYVVLVIGLIAAVTIGIMIRRRYKKRLSYYEKILADLPANDGRVQSLIDHEAAAPVASSESSARISPRSGDEAQGSGSREAAPTEKKKSKKSGRGGRFVSLDVEAAESSGVLSADAYDF